MQRINNNTNKSHSKHEQISLKTRLEIRKCIVSIRYAINKQSLFIAQNNKTKHNLHFVSINNKTIRRSTRRAFTCSLFFYL